jgi:hypothetical protein
MILFSIRVTLPRLRHPHSRSASQNNFGFR